MWILVFNEEKGMNNSENAIREQEVGIRKNFSLCYSVTDYYVKMKSLNKADNHSSKLGVWIINKLDKSETTTYFFNLKYHIDDFQ